VRAYVRASPDDLVIVLSLVVQLTDHPGCTLRTL
jgi:hypothetical protein